MDEDQKALNTSEENTQEESPTTEQTTEDVSGQEADVATEADSQGTETDGEDRRSANSRIRELNAKAKAAEQEASSLKEKLAELTNPVGFQGYTPQYNPQDSVVQPGEEIDANEFQRRVLAQADARTELRIRQVEAINRINNEAAEVLQQYPELDPKSDNFNRELSDAVTEATEAYITKSPYTASVKQFVSKLMKPYKGAVDKEVGQATENIAKQVSQAALRPTSIRKQEKSASEKSIAELERELGVVQS